LYKDQKEFCEKNNLKLETKKTDMEFTKKIGFIIGPYVKVASTEFYSEKMVSKLKHFDGSIELKKQTTYEREMKSKVLVVYAVEEEANIIDTEITQQSLTILSIYLLKDLHQYKEWQQCIQMNFSILMHIIKSYLIQTSTN